MATIYTLAYPTPSDIFYVGQTELTLEKRQFYHKAYRYPWFQHNFIEELETCDTADKYKRENYWIYQMEAWGYKIINQRRYGRPNGNGRLKQKKS